MEGEYFHLKFPFSMEKKPSHICLEKRVVEFDCFGPGPHPTIVRRLGIPFLPFWFLLLKGDQPQDGTHSGQVDEIKTRYWTPGTARHCSPLCQQSRRDLPVCLGRRVVGRNGDEQLLSAPRQESSRLVDCYTSKCCGIVMRMDTTRSVKYQRSRTVETVTSLPWTRFFLWEL